ncbi:hypothetical protein V8C42DRAFT_305821 [Trichoderma barbatum]
MLVNILGLAIAVAAPGALAGATFGCANVCDRVIGAVGTTANCGQGDHYWMHKRDENSGFCFGGLSWGEHFAGACGLTMRYHNEYPVWWSNDGTDCSYLNGGLWYMDNAETIVQEQDGNKYWCYSGTPEQPTTSHHFPGPATCWAT